MMIFSQSIFNRSMSSLTAFTFSTFNVSFIAWALGRLSVNRNGRSLKSASVGPGRSFSVPVESAVAGGSSVATGRGSMGSVAIRGVSRSSAADRGGSGGPVRYVFRV